jgi:hypothetical protein
MIVVYTVRHAPRLGFTRTVPDIETGLSADGHALAEKQMAPALREDIDKLLKAHPGQDYSIEIVYAPSTRTVQTKDHLLGGLKGLHNITETEDFRLGHGDLGEFFGLSDEERAKKSSYANILKDPAFKKDPSLDFLTPLITGGDSKADVVQSALDAMREHKLEDFSADKRLPALRIKIFVAHSLACQAIRRDLNGESMTTMLDYDKHNAGSIRKFTGATMFTMKDEGLVFEGPPDKSEQSIPSSHAR